MQLFVENQSCRIRDFSSDIFQEVGFYERANLCVCEVVCVLEKTQYPDLLHWVIQETWNLNIGAVKNLNSCKECGH